MFRQSNLDPNPISREDTIEIKKDYQIIKKVGSGGFSTVFKAYSYYLVNECALKVIPKFDRKGDNKQPFIANEIKILQRLEHRFIIRLLHYEVYNQTSCLALEFCERGDLAQMVQQSRIPENIVKRYILDISTAIDYLHSRDIIHRDLKLDNILLDSEGNIKITDFGLATIASSYGLAYGQVGCSWAKAPEMLTQTSYNKSVDWWSVGVMLFKMVTGDDPFKPSHGCDNVEYHIINSPLRIPPRVSPACCEVIEKLLDKNPASRIGSLSQLKSCGFFDGVLLH